MTMESFNFAADQLFFAGKVMILVIGNLPFWFHMYKFPAVYPE